MGFQLLRDFDSCLFLLHFICNFYVSLCNLSFLFVCLAFFFFFSNFNLGLWNLLLLFICNSNFHFVITLVLVVFYLILFTTMKLACEMKPKLIMKTKRSKPCIKTCTIHHQNNQSSYKVSNSKHSKCLTHSMSCKFHKSWLSCPNSCCNLEQCITYKHYV
jgi:hypothetical protein